MKCSYATKCYPKSVILSGKTYIIFEERMDTKFTEIILVSLIIPLETN
jgi:hypothetical protein